MLLLLLILLVALPIAEVVVFVQVAGSINLLNALALLILVSMVGVWLAKREGLSVVTRMRRAQERGEVPSRELADGALILLASALLVLPGFLSDVIGILLLLPPVRAGVRTLAMRRFRNSASIVTTAHGRAATGTSGKSGSVWDVESWEQDPDSGRKPPGELGGSS
jgi:UPF0716 protein FxsA